MFKISFVFNIIERCAYFEQKHLAISYLFINFVVFNIVEQDWMIEQMSDQEILDRAVAALNSNLHWEKATVDYCGETPYLTIMGKRFLCIVEPNLALGTIIDRMPDHCGPVDKDTRILFVTVNATPKMLELAKSPDVNVLDCAGNFNIQFQMKNGDIVLMLANKGEKPVENRTAIAYPIFLEKGLKVIFYLLVDKQNVGRPYRKIVDATDVAIGTVKNVIDGMIYQRFVRVEKNKRFLTNIDRLLMLWSANYELNLKPKLFLARFAFRDEEMRRNWKHLELPEGMLWGGEPAAALNDGFIVPGEFTVYADVPAATLMKTGAVVPDTEGEIAVYRKFWKEGNPNTVPPVLTYADLMDTANGRCIEAAQKMKEYELKYLL